MLSATKLTLDIFVTVDTRALAKAIHRLANSVDRDSLSNFATSLAEDLFIEDEEVAEDFARLFAKAHAQQLADGAGQ